MILYCATTNPGKLREFRAAAVHWSFPEIAIESLPGLTSIEAPVEDGASFEQNAALKAMYYSRYTQEPVFADDSGLMVDALDGAPGIHSARFAGPGASDADNNRLLLQKLDGLEQRSSRFVCAIALARGGNVQAQFQGTVEGRILGEARGANGFGYDPLFFYEPFRCTFGEIDGSRKMDVSHRGQALRSMLTWCRESLSNGRS